MPLNMRSLASLIRKGALVFLALAVFGLGLHARLEVYKTASSFNPTSAKVSTEKHSEQLLRALREHQEVPDFLSILAYGLGWSSIFAEHSCNPIIQSVEIGLFSPARYDQKGDYSLHRPPPSLT
jgi:hypothetical protein